eukprot:GHUV01054300.1.p1 GENE.GHUV01054300.1~~GHUV01054300.1.p1  ORF type:complete len:421 (+),score=126.22 GHUV01054300.1:532-1794(+)
MPQILRKRAAQDEQAQRRRSLRAKGSRRVSFAPDDELETMHLFKTDKQSPLPSQDTLPLAELVQNHMQPPQHEMLANLWHPEKPAAGINQAFDSAEDQFVMQSPAMPAQSPGLTGGLSPMSMELTNDTLQQTGSLPFAAADDGSGVNRGQYGSAGFRDATHNITDNVPCLSTLVEEDEDELYDDTSTNDGSAMELTGNTDAAFKSPLARPVTHSAAAATPPALPNPSPASNTRSRRSSKQGSVAASPASDMLSPKTRSRRGSTGRGKAAAAADVREQQQATPPSAGAATGGALPLGRRGYAPSQDPTPSPLRRITRSMTPEKGASMELSPLAGLTGLLDGGLGAAAGRNPRRSTLNRFADQQNKWGFVPGEEDTMMLDMNMPGKCAYRQHRRLWAVIMACASLSEVCCTAASCSSRLLFG